MLLDQQTKISIENLKFFDLEKIDLDKIQLYLVSGFKSKLKKIVSCASNSFYGYSPCPCKGILISERTCRITSLLGVLFYFIIFAL